MLGSAYKVCPGSDGREAYNPALLQGNLKLSITVRVIRCLAFLQVHSNFEPLETMVTQNEPADPIVKGIVPTAKQAWADLFKWKQRVVVTNDLGETHTEWQTPPPLKNPISLFMQLGPKEWLYFLAGLFAWTADAFDFHALSIQTKKLSDYYGRSKTDITTAITLTLLLRSVGAAVFGGLGDRFGRKWPMVINMFVLGKKRPLPHCCD